MTKVLKQTLVSAFFYYYYSLRISVPLQKVEQKRHIIRHNFDNVTKLIKGPSDQLKLFIYSIAMLNIVSMATEKTVNN